MSHHSATSARLHSAPPDLSDLGLDWPSTLAGAIWRGAVVVLVLVILAAAVISLRDHQRREAAGEQGAPVAGPRATDDQGRRPVVGGKDDGNDGFWRDMVKTLVLGCLVCVLVGALLTYVGTLGPQPVRVEGPYDPSWSDLSPYEVAAAAATVVLGIALPLLLVSTAITAITATAVWAAHRRR